MAEFRLAKGQGPPGSGGPCSLPAFQRLLRFLIYVFSLPMRRFLKLSPFGEFLSHLCGTHTIRLLRGFWETLHAVLSCRRSSIIYFM